VLPTFFVIGAAKCGTTSFDRYLAQHPEIHMSPVKEPRFFAEARPDRRFTGNRIGDLEAYERLFESGAQERGETSPSYSMYPYHLGVPERIHRVAPDAKFIYLVRDPIKRVVAHYVQQVAGGRQTRPLAEALGDLDRPEHPVVCPGRYATQIEHYLQFFPAERMHIIDQEVLRRDRRQALRGAFAFLEVDPDYWNPDFDALHNVGSQHRQVRVGLAGRLRRSRLRRVVDPMPPALRDAAVRAGRRLGKGIERPELEPQVKTRLEELYRPEVERLRALTGQPFASWSV
jgi:hypothetical protein